MLPPGAMAMTAEEQVLQGSPAMCSWFHSSAMPQENSILHRPYPCCSGPEGESAARRATSVNTHGKPSRRGNPFGQGTLCMRFDDFTGRKSPGNEAESATPKGKDPPARPLLLQGGPGAACHSYSNVAGGDPIH